MKIQNFWLPAALLVAMSAMMFSCIVPVNTSMESARMLGTGNVEVTGSFSSYSLSSDGESVGINDNIGLRVGYGLSDKVDLKAPLHSTDDLRE
jgi:hypothetical protein